MTKTEREAKCESYMERLTWFCIGSAIGGLTFEGIWPLAIIGGMFVFWFFTAYVIVGFYDRPVKEQECLSSEADLTSTKGAK